MLFTNGAFTILDSVDSTNNYAMAQAHAGLAKHGDSFFAHHQTGGKGQRGNNWHTGNGENIAISIVAGPKQLPVAATI
jgi:BirA family biotin operon repressor/biotin-[acetyl-CoA-carboxylase] ligase